ncbi:methyltransferase [Fodinicola acaciae]|uniref:methyltransferase n=1 Tax=Fodinicola acaciae TaxID=2681555 RepID=UPI0013D69989|nr:methyltransferase [Fodinicola acaciae]
MTDSAWDRLAPVMDLVTPMAVRVAATLRLADLLADGPRHVDELAGESGTDADALGRLLRHLVCHGVFAEPATGRFASNDLADLLRSDHPERMRDALDLDGFNGRMDLAFTGLLHTVRTGQPAWETVFGAPIWDYLAANPELSATFDAMMAGSSRAKAVAEYDWSGVRHLADVGGGSGALLAEVLRANPGIRGTLVDLPDTVDRGRQLLTERGLADRCDFVGQSFFEPLPAGADVYVLAGVLHDWADEEAVAILRRCVDAAGPDGRVLIVESRSTQAMDAEMDLRMLVFAGGRERDADGFGALAKAVGLRVSHVRTIAPGYLFVDCVPGD